MDDLPPVLQEMCATAAQADAAVAAKLATVSMLLSHGYIDRARAILLTLLTQPPAGQNTLLDICRRIERGDPLLRQFGTSATGRPSEVMLAIAPAATRLLLLFPGTGGRFWGVNNFALIRRPDLHLMFLRLRTERLYIAGIDGLGDTYAACLAAIRGMIGILAGHAGGELQVYCVGHSLGGYAALRFGLDLGAASVLAFSAPTTLDVGNDADYLLALNPEIRLLYELDPKMAADLRSLYQAHPSPPSVVLCYGDQHAEDVIAAQRMAQLPRVRLEPIAGYSGHDTLWEAMQQGKLEELLDALLNR